MDRDLVDSVNDMAGVVVEVVTPKVADTEFAVRHPALGRIASEFHVLLQDAPGHLYRSNPTKWTQAVSFLKYSAPGGGRLRIRVR
jgi:hypothetical protein